MFFQDGAIKDRAAVSWADNVDAILDDTYSDGRKTTLAETAGQIFGSTLSFLIPTGAVGLGMRAFGAGEKLAHASALTTTALACRTASDPAPVMKVAT